MSGQKLADLPGKGRRHFIAEINESRALLGNSMAGKKALFVVDDIDHRSESLVLRMGVFQKVGAHEESGVLKYSEFLSNSRFQADALILRSSRVFPARFPELTGALRRFRQDNPKSAVVLCVFDDTVFQNVLPLLDSAIINAIDTRPPNDFELLRKAADIIARFGPQ